MAQTMTIQPSTSDPATETRTFALRQGGKLKISVINGDVKISAWDKDEVALKANFKPSSRNKQHSKIKVNSNNNSLKLTVKHPKEINEIGSCSMELFVPRQIRSNIRTMNSSITFDGITGKNKARTLVGDILLNNIDGNTKACSMVGTISGSIKNVENNLKLSTYTGNINVKLLNANGTLKAFSRHGTMRIAPSQARIIRGLSSKKIIATLGDGDANMKFKAPYGSIIVE
jgi:DUF4097 and DUF4098 domain-containing protein YvlB